MKKNSWPRFVGLPVAVYVACFPVAWLIASVSTPRCTDNLGAALDVSFGFAAGVLLLVSPWLSVPGRSDAFKLFFGTLFVLVGLPAWAASYLFSGIFQICW